MMINYKIKEYCNKCIKNDVCVIREKLIELERSIRIINGGCNFSDEVEVNISTLCSKRLVIEPEHYEYSFD